MRGLPDIDPSSRPKAPRMKKPKAKVKTVYYVMGIKSTDFIKDVEPDFLGTTWHTGSALTISCFSRCETIEEARKDRKRLGGMIFVGAE